MIPKIIHTCWVGGGTKNELMQKCINSWKKFLPDYEIKEWNESNFDINELPEIVRIAYNKKIWAFVSDYVRFYVIHKYGGIYLDYDVEFIKEIDLSILNYEVFFGTEQRKKDSNKFWISGHIIGCNKNNLIIEKIIEFYKRDLIKTKGIVLPVILTNFLLKNKFIKLINLKLISNTEKLMVFDYKFFSPIYGPFDYNINKIYPETIAIHWSNSWTANINNWSKSDLTFFKYKHLNFIFQKLILLFLKLRKFLK